MINIKELAINNCIRISHDEHDYLFNEDHLKRFSSELLRKIASDIEDENHLEYAESLRAKAIEINPPKPTKDHFNALLDDPMGEW